MSNQKPSKLHPKFQTGVFVVSGLWGLGKSTLAFTAERPDRTAILDFDMKGEQMARDYGIRFYESPKNISDTPTDYDIGKLAKWFMDQLKAIPEGTTTLVLDNATWVEAGLEYIVAQNPSKYGVRAVNIQTGKYGGANPGITKLWVSIVTHLQTRGVNAVFAINHMTPPWVNHAPVLNKYIVRGNKIFRQICTGALILTPPDPKRGGQPPVPSALVAKEAMAIRRWDEERDVFVTQRALPMRIPIADWEHINAYFEEPANFGAPAAGETWNQFELNAYGDWLSQEQVEWVKEVASYSENENESEKESAPGGREAQQTQARIDEAKKAIMRIAIQTGWMTDTADGIGARAMVEAGGADGLTPDLGFADEQDKWINFLRTHQPSKQE